MKVGSKFVNRTWILVSLLAVCVHAQSFTVRNETNIQKHVDKLIDETPQPSEKQFRAAEKYIQKGIRAHEKGKYKKAIKFYNKALKKVPIYGAVYYELAFSQYQLGYYENAYANTIRALVFNPGMEMAHILKASLLDDLGYPAEAVTGLQALLDVYPESTMAWLNLGITQLKLKDYPSSEASLLQAVRCDSTLASGYYYLFVSASLQGYTYEEEKWIEKYLALAADNDPRKQVAIARESELDEKQLFLNPSVMSVETDLMEGLVRSEWRSEKHRKTYPSERGYKPSLGEEREVAASLLALNSADNNDVNVTTVVTEKIKALKRLDDKGFIDAYFYVALHAHLGEDDLHWGEEHRDLIERYLQWQESQTKQGVPL